MLGIHFEKPPSNKPIRKMITKYRTQTPAQHPFNELMSGLFNRDIGQLIGQDEPTLAKPRVNITETPEAYLISLSVPGFSKEQLKISTENETLTISGEHAEEALSDTERYTRREFKTASFTRAFRLPELVDLDGITADHNNGMLAVRIPRTQPVKPATRAVTIK